MKRNPFKDKSIPKPTPKLTPKPQHTMTAEEQKAFEAEVQERIRQAKLHLKASNPFTKEELAQETKSDETIPNQLKPIVTSTAVKDEQKAFEDEVQERIRQAKLELKANNPFVKQELESSPTINTETQKINLSQTELDKAEHKGLDDELQKQIQEAIQNVSLVQPEVQKIAEPSITHTTTNQTTSEIQDTESHNKLEEHKKNLEEAEKKIKELEQKLELSTKNKSESHTQNRKPVYGMSAAQPNHEPITKEDLKMEFLNFTSAHIDQFNNRIRKTEELVAGMSNTPQQIAPISKSGTSWTQWLNTALLSICTLLLLAIYFKKDESNSTKNTDNLNDQVELINDSSKETPEKPKAKSEANTEVINSTEITQSETEKPISSPITAVNENNALPAKKETNITQNAAPKTNTLTASTTSRPAQANTASTPPPPTNLNNQTLSKTPSFSRQAANPTPAVKNEPSLTNKQATPAPSANQTPQGISVKKASPVKTSSTIEPQKTNLPKTTPAKQQNIQDAIRPVENVAHERKVNSKKTPKQPFEKKPILTKPTITEEPKPIAKPQTKKPKTQTNDVFFGDD